MLRKTVENILKESPCLKGPRADGFGERGRTADEFIKPLKKNPYARKISACGSLRRMRETVGDIDILAVSAYPDKIMDAFLRLPDIKDVSAQRSH